ncbi:class I SAM-dependent methyltransferase [candidate division KSB1 bacterium]|nr:class I SAM-dependent methyltransferase [candidate division KSB1 bacterium]
MAVVYDAFAPFYDIEYGHKEDDLPFYADLADTYGDPILEIGVGTARVSIELALKGHQVWGVDHSVRMLELARRKIRVQRDTVRKRIRLVQADMRRFDLAMTFNLCIIPFRTFLHNLTPKQQISTLKSIYNHLTDDGILALDLFVPLHQVLGKSHWRVSIPPEELNSPDKGITITADIRHDPAGQLLIVQNIYHQPKQKPRRASMRYRYVFRYEMELLLNLAGFKVLSCTGGFSGEPYDFHSGMMCFVAKKQLNSI